MVTNQLSNSSSKSGPSTQALYFTSILTRQPTHTGSIYHRVDYMAHHCFDSVRSCCLCTAFIMVGDLSLLLHQYQNVSKLLLLIPSVTNPCLLYRAVIRTNNKFTTRSLNLFFPETMSFLFLVHYTDYVRPVSGTHVPAGKSVRLPNHLQRILPFWRY